MSFSANPIATTATATPATSTPLATVDVRQVPPRDRHPLIFSTFRSLAAGEAMELVNDHDPAPLRAQFEVQLPGGFEWVYLQAGPETWRVRIAKRLAQPAAGGCCGGCCGGAG